MRIDGLTNTPLTETLWCKIRTISGDTMLLGVCYHSTSANAESEQALHSLLSRAHGYGNPMLVVGDFNHNTIDWHTLQAGAQGAYFLELTQDLFLTQHVLQPTRMDNTLDLVLSSEATMVDNLLVRDPATTTL